jgi:hypothetical protein
MEMGPSPPPEESRPAPMLPDATWVLPIPDAQVEPVSGDPAEIAARREPIRSQSPLPSHCWWSPFLNQMTTAISCMA